MHFLILGANGRTGQLVTDLALKAGHTVTALVRTPASMTARRNLRISQGTPLDEADIEAAFTSAARGNEPITAVISTLNAARKTDSLFSAPVAPPFFVRNCVRNALRVMQRYSVRNLVVMSAFGVGSSWTQLPWVFKTLFRYSKMWASIEDHNALDAEIWGSEGDVEGVEWVLVRPAMLNQRAEGTKGKEVRECGETGEGVGLLESVEREGVAEYLVQAAEGRKGWNRAVVIAN